MRRNFNPYTDIDWDAPEFSVTQNDPRWVLTAADPVGRHPWYGAQPPQKQIAIGMWRQANVAKVAVHLESILIRGLMHYTFWVPNGSPEYRYCLHESVEECNHTMMLGNGEPHRGERSRRDAVAALGVAGVPALAGPVPIDHTQKNVLREGKSLHPIVEKVMAIHVAEEARARLSPDAA